MVSVSTCPHTGQVMVEVSLMVIAARALAFTCVAQPGTRRQ